MALDYNQIRALLDDPAYLLDYKSQKIKKDQLYLPSPTLMEEMFKQSNRSEKVIANLKRMYGTGRLANTGYLSILPIDQGIEHGAGFSFAHNPIYFDPENIVKLAIEGGCNAVTSTFGALGIVSNTYADKMPFIVKINHNELLSFPNKYIQTMFGKVKDAYNMGAAAVGATVYFGSEESRQQIEEVSQAFAEAHELGLATVLWCYTRNDGFKVDGVDYHNSADLSGQAIHLGVTMQADIIKQKLPENNGGMKAINAKYGSYSKIEEKMYTDLTTDHPIDLTRYQVANSYMGRISMINSGGELGSNDEQDAVKAAVINKRAGGSGMIMGRKAYKKPFEDGIRILNMVQDVYLCPEITIA